MDMDLAMAGVVVPDLPKLDDGTGEYVRGFMTTLASLTGRRR